MKRKNFIELLEAFLLCVRVWDRHRIKFRFPTWEPFYIKISDLRMTTLFDYFHLGFCTLHVWLDYLTKRPNLFWLFLNYHQLNWNTLPFMSTLVVRPIRNWLWLITNSADVSAFYDSAILRKVRHFSWSQF